MTDRPDATDPTPATDRPQGDRPDGDRDALEQVADRTSERIQPADPYTEPPNSTVEDWFGQRVEHDAELLEQTDPPADPES